MTSLKAHLGDAHHAMPLDIASIVADAQWRTQKQAGLTLVHAVQLDRQLMQMGFAEPVTYAQHGMATLQNNTDDQALHWRQTPAGTLSCLHQAQSSELQPDDALAQAYAQARGPEIPALNLLYANSALDLDSLWLHFLNKYLAHHSLGKTTDNSLSLAHGAGSRFDRLQHARRPAHHHDSAHGPLVSVIMPVFNASVTLRKAAQSILNQTWRNLELILVDDQSQDDSLAIANQLRAQDARVRVLALPTNGGPYVAKNLALAHATGHYLTVHDADDWAFSTRIALQMQPLLQADSGGLAVIMGRSLRCDMHGQFTRFQPLDWVSLDGALRLCFPSPLFSRAYFDQKLGAWDSVRFGADYEIFQRIRKFDPSALQILDTPVMLQLDLPDSLTRHEDTHNDERGEAPARTAYRKAWSARHAEQTAMPKLHFPKTNYTLAINTSTAR